MAIIYRIEGLVPTPERYRKYYWLKYIGRANLTAMALSGQSHLRA